MGVPFLTRSHNKPMHAEASYVAQLFVVSLRSFIPQKLLHCAGPVIEALCGMRM